MRHVHPTVFSAALLAVACALPAGTAAADTGADGATVTGKVVWDAYGTVHGADVELVPKGAPEGAMTRRTSQDGSYTFTGVPSGTYVLRVSDPSERVLTKAPAETEVVVDGDATLPPSTLERDDVAAAFVPCASPQTPTCIEALTVTLPGGQPLQAQSDGALQWGRTTWTVPGTELTSTGPVLLDVYAGWANPWGTSAPLGADPRAYGASVSAWGTLPDETTIGLRLRGVTPAVPSYVFANARDTVFTGADGSATMSGKFVSIVDGPITSWPWSDSEDSTDIRRAVRKAWTMTAAKDTRPCVAGGETVVVSTNSFMDVTPTYDAKTRRMKVTVAGTHFMPGYVSGRSDNEVNHTGYFQVALPSGFVTDDCGWGTTLEEVLHRAKAAVSEDGKAQQVKSTAVLRPNPATGQQDLVVTVQGFHYSTPTIEVSGDAEPLPVESPSQQDPPSESAPTPATPPVVVPSRPVVKPVLPAKPAVPAPVPSGTVKLVKPAVVLSPAKALPVTGTIAKVKAGTKVHVQIRQRNGTWVSMAVTRTNAKGEFAVGLKAPAKKGVYTYRVLVPGTRTPQVLTVTVR